MHRSATSLITHWLYECGLEIGESLLGPGIGNIEGHFEDLEFFKLHVEILRENNFDHSGIIDHSVGDIPSDYKEKIKDLIESKNRRFFQWGWKEPRTCLFLDFYRDILPDACYLVVYRSYQFVVISLLKRAFANFDNLYNTRKSYLSKWAWYKVRRKRFFKKFCRQHSDYFLKVWIFYNEQILKNISNLTPERYLVLNYSMLNSKDHDVLSFLINNWQFSLQYKKFSDTYNEKLFSEPFNMESYISDKELINKAKNLENVLETYAGF